MGEREEYAAYLRATELSCEYQQFWTARTMNRIRAADGEHQEEHL